MIDFWRKKHNRPDIYIDLIDQEGYNKFIESCLNTLRRMKIKVINVENGDINYVKDKNRRKRSFSFWIIYLGNMWQLDDKEKLIEIENHFNKFQFDDNDAFNYFFKDFDICKAIFKSASKVKRYIAKYR